MAPTFDKDYVLKTVEERDVHFVRFWFTDVLGMLKSFAVTDTELEGAFEEGMGFDGSSIDGFTRLEESDMVAYPEPRDVRSSCRGVPPSRASAACSATSSSPTATPFEGDPRYALQAHHSRRPPTWASPCTSVPSSSSSTSPMTRTPRSSTTAATST